MENVVARPAGIDAATPPVPAPAATSAVSPATPSANSPTTATADASAAASVSPFVSPSVSPSITPPFTAPFTAPVPPSGKPSTTPTVSATLANDAMPSPALWRHAKPSRWNPWLIGLTGLAGLWQWLGLGYALRHWGDIAALTVLPVLLLTPMHWGLIHESIHGQLRVKPRANERTGRALSFFLGLPFEIMRFGHLMHHRFTRQPYDQPDISTLPANAPRARRVSRWLGYQSRLLGGMWATEVFAPLIAWIPVRRLPSLALSALGADPQDADVRRRVVMFASDPVRRHRIRRDFLLMLVALGLALWAYGPWWPVFVATFVARGVWLSIADNLPHFGVTMNEPARSRNFHAPALGGVLVLNHHLHRVHHQYPTAPWHLLPEINAAQPTAGPVIPYWRAIVRQFRGPLPTSSLVGDAMQAS
ncbi:fatty acid desaturase family protein [Pandoraea anhela]|uniref:Fatty acid desaturase n=1 Tax=Pandoraea anhela TaxID=2508295 RepID=A0A5E4VI19_9BURK|nr:fatty acid desaturase [Pandoraea anhela]VVE10570.1 fatty acid desaturase [Pandoraea anhela]